MLSEVLLLQQTAHVYLVQVGLPFETNSGKRDVAGDLPGASEGDNLG